MAAPLGWKDFASGDVLTAADMDGYVMAQIIGVFTDATARDASITSPQEGQHAWLKSDDSLYYVNAAGAWVASPVGDITSVTAGSGLAGGGATGALTLTVDTDAKGDLIVGTGADTATKLTAGSNTYVLTADSTTASGLVWSAAPADATKMPLAGGTFTGVVTFDGASPIVLEGLTANAHETTITVTDPTADRVLTLPDATGTVALITDIPASVNGTSDNIISNQVFS